MSHCKLFGKREGAFKQHLEGDWTNYLSVTVDHRLTSANQINSRRALPAVPVLKSLREGGRGKIENIFRCCSLIFFK